MTNITTKKQLPGILPLLIKLIQIILYLLIQIIFIPFLIIGLIVGFYKEMANSKKYGVSFSAGQALQYRWFMHYLETRPDPHTVAFVKKFPCESLLGLWTTMGALIISQRLFGFKTKLSEVAEPEEANLAAISGSRVAVFDRIMEKYLDKMEQIVLPGVGFDLIALPFTEGKNLKVFEIDQVNTLKVKVETLKEAGIKHDWITYIPVDYASESWVDKLIEAGFDNTKKTLFLWQSVSLYLDEKTVKDTLRGMAELCVDGSVIAQDFYSKTYSSGEYSFIAKRNMALIARMGEPAKFGIDMSNDPKAAVESFLKECGLEMTEYIQFGKRLNIEPFYCIVEAEKQ
jgi:methyltransferase (TIGR00027 family)